MAIELTKEQRTRAVASIERYFKENMDETIGNIGAAALLGFFLDEIGTIAYNRGVQDAQSRLLQAVNEVDIEVHEAEFDYWHKFDKARRR
jgi:uncharacterized protein (DUF2164 family)